MTKISKQNKTVGAIGLLLMFSVGFCKLWHYTVNEYIILAMIISGLAMLVTALLDVVSLKMVTVIEICFLASMTGLGFVYSNIAVKFFIVGLMFISYALIERVYKQKKRDTTGTVRNEQ